MALSTGSRVTLGVIVLLVAGVLAALGWANSQIDGSDGPEAGQEVAFQVELGTSLPDLAAQLEADGVIRNATAFRAVARVDGFYETLEAGDYELETGMAADEVIAVFRAGARRAEEQQFRVEEGLSQVLTIERIAEQFVDINEQDLRDVLDARLEAGANVEGVLQLPENLPEVSELGPDVRYPFEGLLFPETYRVAAEASAQDLLQRMVDQLVGNLDGLTDEQLAFLDERGLTVYDAMTIASLIERETRVDSERAMVASVIYNRLEVGMALQIDATVLYALGEWKSRVLTADTEFDSPYNTYVVNGLPPTPISGFGRASLEAALAPADTDFRFYVLKPSCDGSHEFAEDLDGHNRNVAEFRAAGNCLDGVG